MCAKNVRAHLPQNVHTLFSVCTAGYGWIKTCHRVTHPELTDISMVLKGGLTRREPNLAHWAASTNVYIRVYAYRLIGVRHRTVRKDP